MEPPPCRGRTLARVARSGGEGGTESAARAPQSRTPRLTKAIGRLPAGTLPPTDEGTPVTGSIRNVVTSSDAELMTWRKRPVGSTAAVRGESPAGVAKPVGVSRPLTGSTRNVATSSVPAHGTYANRPVGSTATDCGES